MDFQFQPGSSSMMARNMGSGSEEREEGEDTRVYGVRGAGGKLRASRKSTIKKMTPYDRPASGRHSTAGGLTDPGVSATPSLSLASRLVGSASRLITSSASYFFPSIFACKTPALTNGDPAAVQRASIDEQDEKEESDPVVNQEIERHSHLSRDAPDLEEDLAIVAVGDRNEKKELDLVQVENMLKQKTWSRDQVTRLTDLLNNRLVEHPPSSPCLAEAGVLADDTAVRAAEVTPHRAKESRSTPITEAQRWREELKRARTDCMPIEVAKAYMGERTSLQSGLSRSFRGTPHQIDRVAELQPPPGLGLADDRFRSLPVLRPWSRSPAAQVPKRSPLLDEDWMSVGPVRRTRHKTFHLNSSPYSRGLPAEDPGLPRAHVSPPVQSSQTARKILDTLEMMSPSPKARLLNEPPLVTTQAATPLSSDIFNLQGRHNLHRVEVSRFSSPRDMGPSNGKLEFGSPSTYPSTAIGETKELKHEDKSMVNRLHSNNEAVPSNVPFGVSPKGIFSTTSFPSSTVANASFAHLDAMSVPSTVSPIISATSASFQPDTKRLFSFSIPSMAGSQQYTASSTAGATTILPTSLKVSTTPVIPGWTVTAATDPLSTAVSLGSKATPAEEQKSGDKGVATEEQTEDANRREHDNVSKEKGLTSFQFGSSPSVAPFSFKMGTDNVAAEPLSKVSFSSPFCTPKTPASLSGMLDSHPVKSTEVSTVPFMFGSPSVTFPLAKPPSTTGSIFGSSPIVKPSSINFLTVEPSSLPFSFSPPPAPISCSTPNFSFCGNSSPGQLSVNISVEALPPVASKSAGTDPVFTFTGPSGGPKLPVAASEDSSLPAAPKFTFGKGALSSSGDVDAGLAPVPASSESGVVSTSLPSSFTFSGQSASGRVFGSGVTSAPLPGPFLFGGLTGGVQQFGSVAGPMSSPFSSAESPPAATGLQPSANFTSGTTGSEKAGRKFFKAKRRK